MLKKHSSLLGVFLLVGSLLLLTEVVASGAERAKDLHQDRSTISLSVQNLALDKKYTLNPPPAYPLTMDAGDLQYLTDGQYTEGNFWTQKTTVGWEHIPTAEITLDLGEDYPIRGLSVNTAFGNAGVEPAAAIQILVSKDGRNYYEAGDLVALSLEQNPLPAGYAVHRFYTDKLQIHARYLKLVVTLTWPYFFCDEVEVYRGQDDWLEQPFRGKVRLYPREHFGRDLFNSNRIRRIETDFNTIQQQLEKELFSPTEKSRLLTRLQELDREIIGLPNVSPKDFRGIMPMNQTHAEIYALLGAMRKSQGYPPLLAWGANRWDLFSPLELPLERPTPDVTIASMKNEERSDALNLTNCSEQELQVEVGLEGLPGGEQADYLHVCEVAWTDTNVGILIAAALPDAIRNEKGWQITIPAGMTRQIWISFHPKQMKPGLYQGQLKFRFDTATGMSVPLNLRIFDVDFPTRPRMSVGGWDYANAYQWGVTPQNRAALIAFLQRRFVDSPWATRDVMEFGRFDAAGQYQTRPSTANFDQWVADWPDARRYCVYLVIDQNSEIDGTKSGEPLFKTKIAQWINFWVEHATERDIPPERFFLLLVDESDSVVKDKLITNWARAIKAAQPKVVIWDDGSRTAERNTRELRESVDFLCPGRASIRPKGSLYETRSFYKEHVAAGGRLDLYSCSARVKLRDPYTYFRLQAWDVFLLGGEGSQFWSFSGRAGSSWNEYETFSADYAPFFLASDSVTNSKHMEAIRESAADFEYLSMLQDSIRQMEQQNPQHPLLAEARKLAASALETVLQPADTDNLMWYEPTDRSRADAVLFEIAVLLEKLHK